MSKGSILILGLFATIAFVFTYPAAFFGLEFLVCSVALVALSYQRKTIPLNIFTFVCLILLDCVIGSLSWSNAYYENEIISSQFFYILNWISSGIVSAFARALLFEVLMTDTVSMTMLKKVCVLIGAGLAVAWILVGSTAELSLPLITCIFSLAVVLLSFWQVILNHTVQKAVIRKNIIYFMGPNILLFAVYPVLVYSGLITLDYPLLLKITAIITGIRVFLVLSFLTITFKKYLPRF